MHVLIACDSFKDALDAERVCSAIATGLKKADPGVTVTEMPLSDGGEGVLDILRKALKLQTIEKHVSDPLGRPINASYGLSADGKTALVEMATASGLQLLTLEERNPLLTSTYGTGELLADAKARGATTALLAIGGSATNDAGIGMAAALGWQLLDKDGNTARASAVRKSRSAVRRHQSALRSHRRILDLWPAKGRQREKPHPS
jgi:glycerate kinase